VIRYYIGRFRVPRWLFEIAPDWLHRAADITIRTRHPVPRRGRAAGRVRALAARLVPHPTHRGDPVKDLSHLCGASRRGTNGTPIGPCILRDGHHGPVHVDADDVTWTDPEPLADWERELLEGRDDPFATGTRYRDSHGEVWTVGSNGLMHHHSYSQRGMDAVRSEYGPLTRIKETR
jgi:hypothetical protein